ncbi:hypothetical protein AB7Z60_16320 [Proteus mirabilis]|uniref:hypothetical protein n=1 Tax=Morganellaceae TaxID=1903414 RepID=UPI00234A9032|nr:hypothetical protein [Providencia sp. PROV271]
MKELNDFCDLVLVKKYKSLQKIFDVSYEGIGTAKDTYGWQAVTNYINEKTGLSLHISSVKTMFYRTEKKIGLIKSDKSKKTVYKENFNQDVKKPSTEPLQKGDNAESKISDSFKDFKNLNRISLKLIDEYNIDLETLKTLGVMTIQDRSIVESKIKKYCEAIDDERFKEEFSDILKKD